MSATKPIEATAEFDMLPVPEKPRTIQLMGSNGFLFALMSDGRIMERVADNSKLGQPGGPHWAWAEIKGPR